MLLNHQIYLSLLVPHGTKAGTLPSIPSMLFPRSRVTFEQKAAPPEVGCWTLFCSLRKRRHPEAPRLVTIPWSTGICSSVGHDTVKAPARTAQSRVLEFEVADGCAIFQDFGRRAQVGPIDKIGRS